MDDSPEIVRVIHRIGGAALDNLRLKPAEAALNTPGFSVLLCDSASAAAKQIRQTFPQATALHRQTAKIASTNAELVRQAGFAIMHVPTRLLPNHHRIVHADGAAGFTDDNLIRLAQAFTETQVDLPS